jgi:high-affinity iron transporter
VTPSADAATLNIIVLVFREGLECILVLAAITASMNGEARDYRRPVALGATVAFFATIATWLVAVRAIDALDENFPALQVQAATGLLAVIVLLIVMNWFFHKVYWTGWISLHTTAKRDLLAKATRGSISRRRVVVGLVMLGFSSLYREGVEVVLFLQTYRLQLGTVPIAIGTFCGLALTALAGVLTFRLRRHLPYRKMLVVTGLLLSVVLLVMVGEQVQEMQLAHWLPTTTLTWLAGRIPDWAELWLSVFPTVETLFAQMMTAVLVFGSYFVASRQVRRTTPVAA